MAPWQLLCKNWCRPVLKKRRLFSTSPMMINVLRFNWQFDDLLAVPVMRPVKESLRFFHTFRHLSWRSDYWSEVIRSYLEKISGTIKPWYHNDARLSNISVLLVSERQDVRIARCAVVRSYPQCCKYIQNNW